jgi:hypothetical protein
MQNISNRVLTTPFVSLERNVFAIANDKSRVVPNYIELILHTTPNRRKYVMVDTMSLMTGISMVFLVLVLVVK